MVAGVLFAALAFFVYGRAGATRNGGQSAADAAALAAAQQSRDDFKTAFLAGVLDPDYLKNVFDGSVTGPPGGACDAAYAFASANNADVRSCSPLGGGRWGFTVGVITRNTVGKSVVRGTEGVKAQANATAIVEPRCSFDPSDASAAQPAGGGRGRGKQTSPGGLLCPGGEVVIDPDHLSDLPDMSDLFTVRLSDQ